MNDRGRIAGLRDRFSDGAFAGTDAVVWEDGTTSAIALGEGSIGYAAMRVNEHGEVTGMRWTPDARIAAFFGRAGNPEFWSLGGASTRPAAINKQGQVVGEGQTPVGETRAFF